MLRTRTAPLLFAVAVALATAGHAAARESADVRPSSAGLDRPSGLPEGADEDLPPLPAPEPSEQAAAPARGSLPPASRYASLDRATCEAELRRRGVPFSRVEEARGVVAPVRLSGPVGGVLFRSMLPAAQRRTSPYEIYDCRLVLALEDFARVLARHDVVEVVHYSVYRPPSKRTKLRGPGRRHTGGLAIDAAIFKTKDGRTMSVEKDFDGRLGQVPCGPKAKPSPSELRAIVCEAADAQLFNVVLTPGFNRAHRNHFHLEVTAGVRWVHVR